MAKEFLVGEQWNAGEEFLRRLSEKQFPVAAAFWAKEPDSDSWYLYIASDRVESSGLREAYGEAMRAFPDELRPWLDVFSIKLIKADDPVTQAVLQFLEEQPVPADMTHVMAHYGGRLPRRHHGGPLLGGMPVEDVWIYPQIPAKETTPP